MTRSSVLTSTSAHTGSSASARTSTTDALRRTRLASGSTAVVDRVSTRRAVPARRPAGSRPAAGVFEYGQCGPGVSQVEHEAASRMGFGQIVAVAVTTAVLALGLIGVANMRADTTSGPAPTSTSIVQDQLGATGAG